jgi:hypothetical protein
VTLSDGFLDLPVHKFVDRLAIGAEGEDDLAELFEQAGWPVIHMGRAEAGARHPPLRVSGRQIKLPDMQVRIPGMGWFFVEVRTKRKGTIPGTDHYGLNAAKYGRTDRWAELCLIEEHAGNAAIAIFDPDHGWALATVRKLRAIGLQRNSGGEWWLIARQCLTPLQDVLAGDLALGLVLNGRAV